MESTLRHCSQNSTDIAKEQISLYKSSLFTLHNASLAAFLQKVEENPNEYNFDNIYNKKILKANSTEKMLDFIESYMKDNMEIKGIDENWITSFYKNFGELKYKRNSKYIEIINGYYNNKIMEIMSKGLPYSKVNKEMDDLLVLLGRDKSISDNNKSILKYAISIGKESYEYWEKNDSKREGVGTNYLMKNKKMAGKDKGKIAQADVESAIGGAFTGGPLGALTGATLGAAWGSAVEGAAQHFGWDWSWE